MKAEVHPWEQALGPYFFSVGIKHGVSLEQIPHFIWQLLGEIDGWYVVPCCFECLG
jgi:hypothetical protein